MGDEPQDGPAERDRPDLGEEPVGSDPVAASRALERAAERLLARAGLDDQQERDVRSACEQLVADRANGEVLDGSIRRLRDLLARASD